MTSTWSRKGGRSTIDEMTRLVAIRAPIVRYVFCFIARISMTDAKRTFVIHSIGSVGELQSKG
jgi:hypothetical protein